MELKINCGAFGKMFGVPNEMVDKYLKTANEIQLKVFLLFLRYNSQKISYSQTASFLGITEKEVADAVDFWKKTSIFEYADSAATKTVEKISVSRESSISPTALSKMTEESEDLKNLIFLLEKKLGKKITNIERQGVVYIYKDLGFNFAVILTLFKYCQSIDKTNIKYIIKIAEIWKEKGIKNLKDANNEINSMVESKKYRNKIYKMFKLNNPMTPSQIEYVDEWKKKQYPDELILLAYQNAIERINKINFKYINTTLLNWDKNGVRSVDDLKKTNSKKTYASVDDELEKYKALANNFGDMTDGK